MKSLALSLALALSLLWSPPGQQGLSPDDTLQAVRSAAIPRRDLADLRSRISTPVALAIPDAVPAGADQFWILDFVKRSYRLATADLRRESAHADWYVERGRDAGDLERAVAVFEEQIYPRVTQLTGVDWGVGAPGLGRITIFNGSLSGVAGYMSSVDAYPTAVFPYSNRRLAVYLNLDVLRLGTSGYSATLSHELEHLAHSLRNSAQEGWLDEGLAELVSSLAMGNDSPALATTFRARPDVQLTSWSELPSQASAHYQASSLWARYLMERGGGPDALPDLLGAGGRGLETVARFAARRGLGDPEQLFLDWLVANVVGSAPAGEQRYGYASRMQPVSLTGTLRPGQEVAERVHQYAADYFELEAPGPADLEVELGSTVPTIGAPASRGAFYWGLRGDNVDTRLTRRFDLSGLERASLRFRVWYDLEPGYDLCYLLASRDGTRWEPLTGDHTTLNGAVGMALGPGYTGKSGDQATWQDEQVRLDQFAGAPVDLQFECVTDQNYSASGFAVDDLEIPELGFSDDVETDQGWQAEGFARVGGAMRQPAAALVIQVGSTGVTVERLPLDAEGKAHLRLGPTPAGGRTILAVAGLAPLTLEEMSYRLRLAGAGS